jgi:hypothetical protein
MAHAPSELRGSEAAFKKRRATDERPAHRWKAPRVRRAPDLFAEAWRTRPSAVPCRFAKARRTGGRELVTFHRVAGARGEIARRVSPPAGSAERRRHSDSDAQHPERNLQSAMQRSHDTRCPSGSGRGRAVLERTRKGVPRRAGRRKATRPWPVKPRLAAAARCAGSRPRAKHRWRCPFLGQPRAARKRFTRRARGRESGDRCGGARGLC